MSHDETHLSGEDKASVREAMYIMIVWTTVVIAAGIGLVFFRDAFAAVFTMAGLF